MDIINDRMPTPPQESLHWKRLGNYHHISNGGGVSFSTGNISGNEGCDDAGGDGDAVMIDINPLPRRAICRITHSQNNYYSIEDVE